MGNFIKSLFLLKKIISYLTLINLFPFKISVSIKLFSH
jgi:hypothetical protein